MPAGATTGDGFIAVSADGQSWVWTPKGGQPHVSHDRGDTWTAVKGLPAGTRVIADRVNPKRFHAMALFDDQLFTSDDSGLTTNVFLTDPKLIGIRVTKNW